MKLQLDRKSDTQAIIEIAANEEELAKIKEKVLRKLAPRVKLSGFRDGKAPLDMVEKNVDQQLLQSEFIDEAVNTLYIAALKEERVRPVGQPKVEVKKFVPFTALEVVLDMPVVGEIKLADYKKHSAKREKVELSKKEVDEVLQNLRLRLAEKLEVKRAAKKGDEAWIDFKGVDSKGEPVKGADGKDYPLALGSGTFIPGFEDEVIGMNAGDNKDFTVTFPKDYGVKSMQNMKVTFNVMLNKVMEVSEPVMDDAFAAKVGPFKSLEELTADIKKQLESEKQQRVERDYEAAILNELVEKTKVSIPESLIEEQVQVVMQEVRQNVVQRGMTYEEYLKQQNMSEEKYKQNELVPEAERRVKAGLILSEIGDKEGIDVTPEELESRIQQLKGQYQDKQMQEQLDQPESRREINARLRSEKVINSLKN
jgi:trigger factor